MFDNSICLAKSTSILILIMYFSRISPKQIKLDKFKALLDSNIPITADLIAESDAHLFSALLKSYLRELPIPFLGREDRSVYDKWIEVASSTSSVQRVDGIRNILTIFPENVSLNIQYLVKFLSELSIKAKETKMTPHNISICLGPTILWNDRSSLNEQGNIERIIGIVATLIESYDQIFKKDIDWHDYEDTEVEQLFDDGNEYQNQEKEDIATKRHSKDNYLSGNSTSSNRSSVEFVLPPAINVQTSNGNVPCASPTSKTMIDNSSPNRTRRGKFGASFKEKFVTKMQNISSPLASKPIEERDDDTDEKRTIE